MRFFKKPANSAADAPVTPDKPDAPPADSRVALTAVADGVQGLVAAVIVDYETGVLLASAGTGGMDLVTASAGVVEVFRAERDVLAVLDIEDRLEDILVTLRAQYHLIRPWGADQPLLLWVAVDRNRGNLGLTRHHLRSVEAKFGFAAGE